MNENFRKIWKNKFSFEKFESMAARHKKLFNGASLENQLLKMQEEIDEHFASPADFSEMADCYITAAGIYNFNTYLAAMILNYLESESKCSPDEIEEMADKKMFINENIRIWNVVNGVIRHIKLPAYPDESGFIDIPDGKYFAKKNESYGQPSIEVVSICGKYLPSHYECVVKKA